MSTQHTPGRIRYDFEPGYCGELIASNGTTVATFNDEPSEADAKRLVACWNACDGVPTELLEAYPTQLTELRAQRDELLKALRWVERHTFAHSTSIMAAIGPAIAMASTPAAPPAGSQSG